MIEKDIPIKGSLKNYSIPQVLSFFNKNKKTGTLVFTNKDKRKSIFFMNGEIIFASSNSTSDRLDELLLKRGEITEEQYHRASEIFEKTRRRKGTILVGMGYLEPTSLFTVIRQQVKEIVLSLFEWQEGEFSFEDNFPSIEVVTLNTSIDELLEEGIKRARNKGEKSNLFIKKLHELYEKIDTMTYYDLLDVKQDASYPEIKKSYLRKVKEFHSDRHTEIEDASLREKLSRVLAMLNEAYNTLKDQRRRETYNRLFIKGTRNTTIPQDINAKEYFIRGIEDYRRGNFWNAADLFQGATRLEPKKAKYWAHLSMALSKLPRRLKDAEEAMLKAINLEPYNVDYHIHLGRFYLNMGMRLRAKAQFETALKIDPDNLRVKEELERLKVSK